MASTIASFPFEADNGNGTSSPLPGLTVKVYDVTGAADVATVTTDSDGNFPATSVSGAAGSLYRIRAENYQGKAGFVEVLSV